MRHLLTVLLLATLSPLVWPTTAQAIKLGVMGDSLSDEYFETSYGSYAQNWVQQLVVHGGVDVGPTAAQAGQGTWGEPRRTGYQFNWARAGANSNTLLSAGQHTGLAANINNQGVEYAVLVIGANDFAPAFSPTNPYVNIYSGTWSQTQINNHINSVVNNITTAVNTVVPTGVNLVLVNVPDYGVTPAVQAALPDAQGRQAVADVIAQVNAQLSQLAKDNEVTYVDLNRAAEAMFGSHGAPNSVLTIGGVDIHLAQQDTSGGGNPTAGFVHDGIHPNTTLQGLMSNLYMTALNVGYGAGAPIFSEAEILAHRGIAYGGSDTLVGQIGLLNGYIINYALPGDGNADGIVDIADILTVGANWQLNTHVGDANFDGIVDIADVLTIGANWQNVAGGGGGGGGFIAAVPEPATLTLAFVLAGLLMAFRFQSRRTS